MKKIYINPEINVMKLSTMQMLAASGDQQLHTGNATEWGSRRGHSVWDDEDEEYEDY